MTAAITMERTPCALCGRDNARPLFTGKDRLHEKNGDFTLVKCRNCGLMYLNPRPARDQMGYFYPAEYGPHTGGSWRDIGVTVGIMNDGTDRLSILKNRIKAMVLREYYGYNIAGSFGINDWPPALPRTLRRALLFPCFHYIKGLYYKIPPQVSDGKALDVGCGSGGYIRLLHRLGWEVWGIDVSGEALSRIPGDDRIHVAAGDLLEQRFMREQFDLVTLWQVLEHLHDPLAALREVGGILKKNSAVFLGVPNGASLLGRLFKDKWLGFDMPRHLYAFTPATIRHMLEQADFSRISIRHVPMRSCLPMALGFRSREKNRSAGAADRRSVQRISFYISRIAALLQNGDILFVSAWKR